MSFGVLCHRISEKKEQNQEGNDLSTSLMDVL